MCRDHPTRSLRIMHAWNIHMNAQRGCEQSRSDQRRRGFPTRLRYLTRLAFLTACSCPLNSFERREDAAFPTSTPVGLQFCNKRRCASMAHPVLEWSPARDEEEHDPQEKLLVARAGNILTIP